MIGFVEEVVELFEVFFDVEGFVILDFDLLMVVCYFVEEFGWDCFEWIFGLGVFELCDVF